MEQASAFPGVYKFAAEPAIVKLLRYEKPIKTISQEDHINGQCFGQALHVR
jgi:hypothetical protein